MRALNIFRKYLKVNLQNHMAYRLNFFFNIVGLILAGVIIPFVMLVIYQISSGIPGWTYPEFLFFYGTNFVVWGVARFFFEIMIYSVEWAVQNGRFDIDLIRPMKTEVFLSVSNPHVEGFPMIIVGILLIISVIGSITFTPLSLIMYIALCFCGLIILYSTSLMIAAAAIKFVKIGPIFSFYWTIGSFTDYPLNIFNNEIILMLTYIFPLGLVSFYPASFLLGRIIDYWLFIGLIITTIIFFFVGVFIFNRGIKAYTSAGG